MWTEYVFDINAETRTALSDGHTAAVKLDALTKEYAQAHAVPYGAAFSEVQKEHPSLAAQYLEALRVGKR